MKVDIKTPCSAVLGKWEEGEKSKFCNQCNLNVHNLSSMTDKEAKDLFANRSGRVCVFMYERRDGSVVTDNCPVALRAMRNKVKAAVAVIVLISPWIFARFANADGLVGAPVDPRYGETGEVGIIETKGPYFLSVIWTVVAFLMAFLAPLAKHKRSNIKVLVLEFLALSAIPFLVYFAGQFIYDSLSRP